MDNTKLVATTEYHIESLEPAYRWNSAKWELETIENEMPKAIEEADKIKAAYDAMPEEYRREVRVVEVVTNQKVIYPIQQTPQ